MERCKRSETEIWSRVTCHAVRLAGGGALFFGRTILQGGLLNATKEMPEALRDKLYVVRENSKNLEVYIKYIVTLDL